MDHSGSCLTNTKWSLKLLIRKGSMKIILAEFNRNVNSFQETKYKNRCPMLTSKQIMFRIFSFFNINKTQGHTMNLNELLNVGLYNDNLKMFSQAWEETSSAFRNILMNMFSKTYTRQESFDIISARHFLKKESRKYHKLRTMEHDLIEHQQQNMRISQKRALKRQSSSSTLFKRS